MGRNNNVTKDFDEKNFKEESFKESGKNKIKNIKGMVFERLEVKFFAGIGKYGAEWHCLCSCGNWVLYVKSGQIVSRHTRSCGCLHTEMLKKTKTKHGMEHTSTYSIWCDMKKRCSNPKNKEYHNYGGRGISYDPRWKDFVCFLEDMGERPEGLTLERIDNEKGYSKENCKWATLKEQMNNQRKTIRLTYNGKTQSINNWAKELNLNYHRIKSRYKKGWAVEKILSAENFGNHKTT